MSTPIGSAYGFLSSACCDLKKVEALAAGDPFRLTFVAIAREKIRMASELLDKAGEQADDAAPATD